jgi:hypothetical protein
MQPFRKAQIEAIAAAICTSREDFDTPDLCIAEQRAAQLAIEATARNLADQMQAVTPTFDRVRFLQLAGCHIEATNHN